MATNTHRMADEHAALLLNLLHHQDLATSDIKEAALCSTVPPLIPTCVELCQRYLDVAPLVVGAGIKTGVRIRMDNPREVGPDRIANAAAAHHLYKDPIIIVDVGTATTFDVISREGDFMGGAIATGIGTAADALFTRAAALPRVELSSPNKAIGTTKQ
jgi:type III pantothenate kinase